MTVQIDLFKTLENSSLQLVAQIEQMAIFLVHHLAGDLAGRTQPDNPGNIQGARTHPALMPAAVHLRQQPHAWTLRANVDTADTLGTIDFVRAHRHEIDMVPLNVNRNLADGL